MGRPSAPRPAADGSPTDRPLSWRKSAVRAVRLYARAIKLPLLPLMAHYFGATFTLVLSGWTLAFAWLSSLVIRRFAAEAAS